MDGPGAELCLFLRKNNKHHTIIHGIALRGFALSAVVVHGRIGVGLKGVHPAIWRSSRAAGDRGCERAPFAFHNVVELIGKLVHDIPYLCPAVCFGKAQLCASFYRCKVSASKHASRQPEEYEVADARRFRISPSANKTRQGHDSPFRLSQAICFSRLACDTRRSLCFGFHDGLRPFRTSEGLRNSVSRKCRPARASFFETGSV